MRWILPSSDAGTVLIHVHPPAYTYPRLVSHKLIRARAHTHTHRHTQVCLTHAHSHMPARTLVRMHSMYHMRSPIGSSHMLTHTHSHTQAPHTPMYTEACLMYADTHLHTRTGVLHRLSHMPMHARHYLYILAYALAHMHKYVSHMPTLACMHRCMYLCASYPPIPMHLCTCTGCLIHAHSHACAIVSYAYT